MNAPRRRLDAELVRRELAPSRTHAQRLIEQRSVTVNGAIAQKAASMVAPADAVEVLAPPPRFVGRGGDKMLGALEAFGLDPTGFRCVDVGSSTGGFTDCLLQHGAESVVAIDVGRAQLHERLRADPRVTVREQTDVRSADVDELGGPFDLIVVDVSFIGLDRILDALVTLADTNALFIVLVKPQFEAGRAEADRGRGVIRDPDVWRRVLTSTMAAARGRGLCVGGLGVSPITGGSGNVEFLLLLGRSDHALDVLACPADPTSPVEPISPDREPDEIERVIAAAAAVA